MMSILGKSRRGLPKINRESQLIVMVDNLNDTRYIYSKKMIFNIF